MSPRCAVAAILLLAASAFALDGEPGMHDPSTVIQAEGKFYVFATRFRIKRKPSGKNDTRTVR